MNELNSLVAIWLGYIDAHKDDAGDRSEGYRSGLQICATQLSETLARMTDDE